MHIVKCYQPNARHHLAAMRMAIQLSLRLAAQVHGVVGLPIFLALEYPNQSKTSLRKCHRGLCSFIFGLASLVFVFYQVPGHQHLSCHL